ncbi:MLO-like protein 12 [Ricinus communis]|uniref:MLO-like protein n=1 Tax=Ricinus communis TaxID=3988 RepID=B9RVS0_RICCO|nr:MLO-like protein 12 [Ricinus communis]EEF44357.1 Protein MLO, putative [Ricinus communis]|eukprot:XP_002517839.1 MLO-like protein 12 isoform X2 [Ricinus communis]
MAKGNASLEHTPTWAISIVCLCFILISLILEAALHYLTEFLRKRKRKSLVRAFEKTETEMMTMGFISLLLTISEAPISEICVKEAVANSFHPCKDTGSHESSLSSATRSSSLSTDTTGETYCQAKGMVSLISREGVMQLKMFISVLAVFHVIYCLLTMFLGMAKMRKWKAWEEETQSLDYKIANDPRRFRLIRQTSFGRRHLKMWSDHPLLLWPVCFIRQFSGSASKADYFTLRNGFLLANVAEGSTFNFQKFLARAFDDDFELVVGVRLWIWMLCLLFIFFSAQEFYNYYWLPFFPLVLVLAVGTKLETIITKMCKETSKNNSVIRGTFLVKPSDEFFWFNHPKLLLYLLQLILIQNSFQLAFFTWAWYQYGLRSCFNQETEDIAIRIITGMVVQFLCGYVTLPIYALVTQMGSNVKRAVFTERVTKGLKNWHLKARHNLSKNLPTSAPLLAIMGPPIPDTREDEEQNNHRHIAARARLITSTPEITTEEASSMVFTRGPDDDDEISFASSWKNLDSSRACGEISSIFEEEEDEISVYIPIK